MTPYCAVFHVFFCIESTSFACPRYKILSHVNCRTVIFPCQEVLLDLVLYGWCSPFFTLITPALLLMGAPGHAHWPKNPTNVPKLHIFIIFKKPPHCVKIRKMLISVDFFINCKKIWSSWTIFGPMCYAKLGGRRKVLRPIFIKNGSIATRV